MPAAYTTATRITSASTELRHLAAPPSAAAYRALLRPHQATDLELADDRAHSPVHDHFRYNQQRHHDEEAKLVSDVLDERRPVACADQPSL